MTYDDDHPTDPRGLEPPAWPSDAELFAQLVAKMLEPLADSLSKIADALAKLEDLPRRVDALEERLERLEERVEAA